MFRRKSWTVALIPSSKLYGGDQHNNFLVLLISKLSEASSFWDKSFFPIRKKITSKVKIGIDNNLVFFPFFKLFNHTLVPKKRRVFCRVRVFYTRTHTHTPNTRKWRVFYSCTDFTCFLNLFCSILRFQRLF